MAIWGGLTNSCEKKRSEKQRRKERYKHLNAEFQRIARREKKTFLSDQCKEIEENPQLQTVQLVSTLLLSSKPLIQHAISAILIALQSRQAFILKYLSQLGHQSTDAIDVS